MSKYTRKGTIVSEEANSQANWHISLDLRRAKKLREEIRHRRPERMAAVHQLRGTRLRRRSGERSGQIVRRIEGRID
jgi:hypothetical protein